MAVARRGFVSIDCADPGPLAEFWAAMLGGDVMFTTDGAVDVRTEWLWISAMKVNGYTPPTWPGSDVPKQVHLDLAVDDLDAAVAEAQALGARLSDVQPAPGRWRVLIDPAGHPFCVTTLIPPEAQ
jgi:predicted enzyme related to lactoylglutathione lyase